MIVDLPKNIVENIFITAVLFDETPETKRWKICIINLKDTALHDVMISSRGYGIKNGREVKTSVLRHRIDIIAPQSFKIIELIDPEVFCLTNEYWLSYYIDKCIYDKKFIFEPNSIKENNLTPLPLINKIGVTAK